MPDHRRRHTRRWLPASVAVAGLSGLMGRRFIGAVAAAAASALVATAAVAAGGPNGIERVSLTGDGGQSEGHAHGAHVSADGRFVAFYSSAADLVADDTNDRTDVFVHDRQTGTTERVSVATDGTQANNQSLSVSIDADGSHVAFMSFATNLVPGDDNNKVDVFVRDLRADTTERMDIDDLPEDLSGGQHPSISADGRVVALGATTPEVLGRMVIRDRVSGGTKVVSLGAPAGSPEGTPDSSSIGQGMISGDGRTLVFQGFGRRYQQGDSTQVFAYDRATNRIELISATPSNADANNNSTFASVSHDGRYAAFASAATDLVAGDVNNQTDIFVRDRQTGAIELASRRPDGTQFTGGTFHGGIGPGGRTVVFHNGGSVWLRDLDAGTTELVDRPLPDDPFSSVGGSALATLAPQSISADDRFVTFSSLKDNLVANDTNAANDVFVRDRGGAPPSDNCPAVANPDQADVDGDGKGDACDAFDDRDSDGDGVKNGADNCISDANAGQADLDGDGAGDACDTFDDRDSDADGVKNGSDNCMTDANADQQDVDGDGLGDACDSADDRDGDNDGLSNATDNCPAVPNAGQGDVDGDGKGDACDAFDDRDSDSDDVKNGADNCVDDANPGQLDTDHDGQGDACDADDDGDAVPDGDDGCATQAGTAHNGCPMPTKKEHCLQDGWKRYGTTFRNQGDCVSYIVTRAKNQPAGT